jgi:hypothetical protein
MANGEFIVPPDDGTWTGWIIGSLIAIISTLAGLVTMFWKMNESKNSDAIATLSTRLAASEKEHSDCRTDREHIRAECAGLRSRVELIEDHLKECQR